MLGCRRQSDPSMRLRKWSTDGHPDSCLNMQQALPPKDMCISFFINTPRVLRYLTLGGPGIVSLELGRYKGVVRHVVTGSANHASSWSGKEMVVADYCVSYWHRKNVTRRSHNDHVIA